MSRQAVHLATVVMLVILSLAALTAGILVAEQSPSVAVSFVGVSTAAVAAIAGLSRPSPPSPGSNGNGNGANGKHNS